MPRADGLPLLQTEISEVPSTTTPLGMRGGSEGGITPGLAVVANAIVDALLLVGAGFSAGDRRNGPDGVLPGPTRTRDPGCSSA
jgi:hypothetical protein